MVNQNKGLHHYYLRKRCHTKHEPDVRKNKFKKSYDKLIYIIVVIAPLINLPQLFKIWLEKDASGVSPLSWFGFSLISITWTIYGILHRDRHIIFMNMALMVIQALIGIGALLYG